MKTHRLGRSFLIIFCLAVSAPAAMAADSADRESLRSRAIQILLEAAAGENAALRSNAIEAMQVLPDRAMPITHRGLSDDNAGVRFASTVTAGLLKFRDLRPAIEPLLQDENESVRAAAVYALHTLGQSIDLTPLGDMLASRDPSLRSNVAMLLGLLGDESAVPMLKIAAKRTMPRADPVRATLVRIQIAEAIARLGDDSALDALRAGLYSTYHEVRVLSIMAMGSVGDRSMEAALVTLLDDPDVAAPPNATPEEKAVAERMAAEIQLAAASTLARFGSARGTALTLKLAAHADPMVRAQAGWSMGWMKDDATLRMLETLMADAEMPVRVTAAASALRRVVRK